MQTLRNKVSLIGRLGQKPSEFIFPNGGKKAMFSIAVNDDYKTKEGTWEKRTQWLDVEATGVLAERMISKLDKGMAIIVDGKLVNSIFTSKSGEKRTKTFMSANNYELLPSKN
jgi:single-strand DNA-binding protein